VRTHRHKITRCINCHHKLDAATTHPLELDQRRPRGGDTTVCIECRHIMIYNNDLTVRNPTDEEIIDLAGDKDIIALMKLFAEFDKRKEHKK
jgi:hypothetical protein